MEKKENETKMPEKIEETEITVVKEPWWKAALRIGGYILAGAAGLIGGMLIGNHLGGDDDDASVDDDTPAE